VELEGFGNALELSLDDVAGFTVVLELRELLAP
jgi:hypothetical protein